MHYVQRDENRNPPAIFTATDQTQRTPRHPSAFRMADLGNPAKPARACGQLRLAEVALHAEAVWAMVDRLERPEDIEHKAAGTDAKSALNAAAIIKTSSHLSA